MSEPACPKCSTPVPEQAFYCPRCGEDLLEFKTPDPVAPKHAISTRELIVGWTLWIVGGLMAIAGLFFLSGSRSWVAVGLGIALFVVGMGTLVGDNAPKEKKRRTRKKD